MGETTYQLVQDFFHQQYVMIITSVTWDDSEDEDARIARR